MQANEYDQVVTVFSEDFGTMRCLARGVYRPTSVQSMHLELFNMVEFEVIQGRALPIISSAGLTRAHRQIRESLPKLAAVHFFTEVLDKIAFENEKDTGLWNFLDTMLAEFDSASEADTLQLFRKYQAEFLKVLGYAPQVDRCVVCSKDTLADSEKLVALSTELGGVMCADCFLAGGRGIMFDKADLGLLAGTNTSATIPATKHSALDTFFEYTVGRKINSLSFLYQVVK
jgi:DNA repair protein RecO (recombination protein O)